MMTENGIKNLEGVPGYHMGSKSRSHRVRLRYEVLNLVKTILWKL